MSRDPLPLTEIKSRLQDLADWTLSADGHSISRVFRFEGFVQAFGFMTECAIFAEKIDHHPEWSNVYRTVEIMLTTHSAKGLTALDFDLATFMDRAAARH